MSEYNLFNQWTSPEEGADIINEPNIIVLKNIKFPTDPISNTSFTETPFFLIDTNTKLFIPERMYNKIKYKDNDNIIRYCIIFKNSEEPDNEKKINLESKIRIIFLTTDRNKTNISKHEYSFKTKLEKVTTEEKDKNGKSITKLKSITTKYTSFTSYYSFKLSETFATFYDLFDNHLNYNFQLYLNRRLLFPEVHYKIDIAHDSIYIFNTNSIGIEDVNTEIEYTFDILAFHSGDVNKIEHLPQSGLIYLDKIDRNYNNNLMAIFINGKLVHVPNIKQINNSIYKIKSRIKTRYDLNILNLSPKIDQLLPFYKKFTYDLAALLNKDLLQDTDEKIVINSKIYNK